MALPIFPNFFASSDSKYWYSDTRIQGNNKFYLFRISYLFLKNFGSRLSLLLVLLVAVPILVVIALGMKNAGVKEKHLKMFNAIRTLIQWNLIISVFLASYVRMVLSFCLQYNFLDRPNVWYDIFSTVSCLLTTLTAASLTIALYLYTRINGLNANSYPNLFKKTKILVNQEGYDPKYKNKYWALASCLRNVFLVASVATLSDYPLVQCSTALTINVIFFLGILKWRFFDRKPKDVIIKVIECVNAMIPVLFFVHAVYQYLGVKLLHQTKMSIGWGIIALVSTVTVLSLVYQAIEMWYVLKRNCSPFYNWLKAFFEYSIGKDIWKRQPRKTPSSSF